jgi:hypothetical protein
MAGGDATGAHPAGTGTDYQQVEIMAAHSLRIGQAGRRRQSKSLVKAIDPFNRR